MDFSTIESRFRIPDKSAKAPARVFASVQSDIQILRDSLTILNVFISPFEEVFTQMIDPKSSNQTSITNQLTPSHTNKSES